MRNSSMLSLIALVSLIAGATALVLKKGHVYRRE